MISKVQQYNPMNVNKWADVKHSWTFSIRGQWCEQTVTNVILPLSWCRASLRHFSKCCNKVSSYMSYLPFVLSRGYDLFKSWRYGSTLYCLMAISLVIASMDLHCIGRQPCSIHFVLSMDMPTSGMIYMYTVNVCFVAPLHLHKSTPSHISL